MYLIEFKDFTIKQKDRVVLNNISVSFKEKGIYSVIGPCESGKTFLLKSINRLIDFEECTRVNGNVIFDTNDIYNNHFNKLKWLRQEIGMIFHQPISFSKDIYENIAIGLRIHYPNIYFPEIIQQVLEKVGLWDDLKNKLNNYPTDFNIEIQQKLALARILAIKPRVILMDNPTVMMDPAATSRFESWILSAKTNYLIIIVTSDIKQAARISDEIIFLKDGYFIEQNTTENFFSSPKNQLTEEYISQCHFI